MKKLLKRTAFLLGVAAVLAAQLHVAHADASHVSNDHSCVVCHTISTGDIDAGSAVLRVHVLEESLVSSSGTFVSQAALLTVSPRAPPLA